MNYKTSYRNLKLILYSFFVISFSISSFGQYVVNFEGASKGAYDSGNITLNGIDWNFTEALIGDLANDFKNGNKSARLRARNGSQISMLGNKANGIGTVSFEYRRYGTDGSQQPYAVEYSTNNGTSWTQIGSLITATETVQTFNETVNSAGEIRIRIRLTTTPGATGDRRLNIDDITITDYVVAGNTIATSAITGSPFCVGSTVSENVNVPFTITGTYTAGNVFTAQLSDASGNFTSPTNIGSLTQTTAGTIAATIPATIPAGSGYRIRVISSTPAINGTENGANLTIQNFNAPQDFVASCGNASASMTWTNPGCFTEVMVVAKDGSFTSALPTGTSYTANSTFGSGTAFDGGFVVYKGTASSSGLITNLTNDISHSFKIFARRGTVWVAGSEQSCTPTLITSAEFNGGDIAIIAVNTDIGSGDDEVCFISFKDITAGTSIDFTDNGFERTTTGVWGDTEGTIRMTYNGAVIIPKGTVICFQGQGYQSSTFDIFKCGVDDNANWTITSLNTTFQFNMNASDQIWIFQGGDWNNPGGTHNAAYSGNILWGWTATGWENAPNYNDAAGSTRPPETECYNTDVNGVTNPAKIKYTGSLTSANQSEWLTRLNNAANWTGYSSNANYDAVTGRNYSGSCITFPIDAGGFVDGLWTGAVNTDWHNCTNWDNLQIPDENTNVVINQTAFNNCEVFNNNAICKSLTLSSNSNTVFDLHVRDTRTLTIQENLEIIKSSGSGNCDVDIYNGGTLNVLGDINLTRSGGTGTASIRMLNNGVAGTLNCTNFTLTGLTVGDQSALLDHDNLATAFVNITGNLTINNGGFVDLDNGTTSFNAQINLGGNWINNSSEGDFAHLGSTINFNGNSNQSISTNGFNEVFYNLVQNNGNSSELVLNSPVEIENQLVYTSGNIVSSLTNLLIFRSNSSYTSVSNASHSNGPVRKIGNTAFTFPIGNGIYFRQASISAPSNVSDHFTAQYFQINPDDVPYDRNLKDVTLDHISACEYWQIDRTNGASNVNVTLSWSSNTSCGVTLLSDLKVARWDGVLWRDHGNGGTTGNTNVGTVITAAAVTSFSPFTLASSSVENPLPVELIEFNALCLNDFVDFYWSTASEKNAYKFILEGSRNAENWIEIGQIESVGNSSSISNYSYSFDNPTLYEYYRLNQIDFNGTSTAFEAISIRCNDAFQVKIYPNPTKGILNIISPSKNIKAVEIYSLDGKLIHAENGKPTSFQTIDLNSSPAGMYYIKIINQNNEVQNFSFVKN